MKTKPNGSYPRYVSIYDSLLAQIQRGVYPAGSELPSENDLAVQYGVSRNTLRQALLLLAEDGCLSNHQGKGTIVLPGGIKNQPSIARLADSLTVLASVPVSKVDTSIEIRQISPKHQKLFDLDASKLLVLIKAVYCSGSAKIGCSLAFVPYDALMAQGIPLDSSRKIRDFYLHYLQTDGFHSDSALRIAYAREPVTQMLKVPGRQLMMMLDETIHGLAGEVVMTQKLFFLPDYYEFSLPRRSEHKAPAKTEKVHR
jgi:GntR family transcriptional regulator